MTTPRYLVYFNDVPDNAINCSETSTATRTWASDVDAPIVNEYQKLFLYILGHNNLNHYT